MARGLNLLSFDSGGIAGLSSLLLIKEVMSRLQIKASLDQQPDPWEHFDLIAGTGTGAICAVMLGRLRMSVDDAIKAYAELASKVYSDKKTVVSGGSGVFRATKLEECLKSIIEKRTGDPNERMMEDNPRGAKCKVVVYAMSAHNMNAGLPCPFRTYPANANAMPDCPIWKALRASTAHPELFKSVEISELGVGQRYVGGGLGCSNPTSQLLKEASSVYPDRPVGSVVSIGTGHARTIQMEKHSWHEQLLPHSIPRVLRVAHGLATDNEKIAEEMATRFSEAKGLYYRLNVNQGMQGVEPSKWEQHNEVAAHTTAYMLQAETSQLIDTIVNVVYEREGAAITQQIGEITLTFELGDAVTDLLQMVVPLYPQLCKQQHISIARPLLRFSLDESTRLEGLLFIDGSSRQNIETALNAFAASKHIGDTYTDALVWLGQRYMHWLMVFDSVDDPAIQVDKYFPPGSRYRILITTRHLEVARLAQGDSAQCKISELSPEDGYRLLLRAAGLSSNGLQESEKFAATALLQKLGYLALAISHCGAYICRNRCSIADYYDMLVAEPHEMLGVSEAAATKAGDYERSVHLTWEISYKQVGVTSKRLLGLATFLHRGRISQDIFRRAYQNAEKYRPEVPPTDLEVDAQREVKDILQLFAGGKGSWSSRLFVEAMGELVCLSLVTFDTISHAYKLHPLVQEWTRALADDTTAAIERSAFLLALSIHDGARREDSDHAFRRAIVLHVNEITSLCSTPSSNNAWQFIKVYDETDQVDRYEQLELQVAEKRTNALGREAPATLEAMAYVAGTLGTKGQLAKAAELYSEVLAIQRRVLGMDHTDTLVTMRALGWTYYNQRRLVEAEALQAEALAARTHLLTDEHPDTLLSMSDLAATYDGLGRFAEAEALNKAVHATSKRVLGDDHPRTLSSMSNLASGYFRQGRHAEAEVLHLETLAARKRVLGDDHHDTLNSKAWLGSMYYRQGRLAEAEILQLETLAGQKRVFGNSHPDTLSDMRNLALTYKAQDRDAAYEELMAQVDTISASR